MLAMISSISRPGMVMIHNQQGLLYGLSTKLEKKISKTRIYWRPLGLIVIFGSRWANVKWHLKATTNPPKNEDFESSISTLLYWSRRGMSTCSKILRDDPAELLTIHIRKGHKMNKKQCTKSQQKEQMNPNSSVPPDPRRQSNMQVRQRRNI